MHISHAIVSATGAPFYSTFVPTHKSFTSLVTTRKSYARGARTSGRDLFPCNLGQREKITRLSLSLARAHNIGHRRNDSHGRQIRDAGVTRLRAGVIKLYGLFQRDKETGGLSDLLIEGTSHSRVTVKERSSFELWASSLELLDLSIYFKFAYISLLHFLLEYSCIMDA